MRRQIGVHFEPLSEQPLPFAIHHTLSCGDPFIETEAPVVWADLFLENPQIHHLSSTIVFMSRTAYMCWPGMRGLTGLVVLCSTALPPSPATFDSSCQNSPRELDAHLDREVKVVSDPPLQLLHVLAHPLHRLVRAVHTLLQLRLLLGKLLLNCIFVQHLEASVDFIQMVMIWWNLSLQIIETSICLLKLPSQAVHALQLRMGKELYANMFLTKDA